MTPARIEELARAAVRPDVLSSEEHAAVAIRTAVLETMEAAAKICDQQEMPTQPPAGELNPTVAYNRACYDCAMTIRRAMKS